jgi:hypothetical protein
MYHPAQGHLMGWDQAVLSTTGNGFLSSRAQREIFSAEPGNKISPYGRDGKDDAEMRWNWRESH